MSDEWPKPWSEITVDEPASDNVLYVSSTRWYDMGPLRNYDGTVYINADGGHERENGDEWLPLGVYLARAGGDEP